MSFLTMGNNNTPWSSVNLDLCRNWGLKFYGDGFPVDFFETSVVTGESVDKAFEALAANIIRHRLIKN